MRHTQPALAPWTASGKRSANTIYRAGAATITAASRCNDASVSAFVAQNGFAGPAKL